MIDRKSGVISAVLAASAVLAVPALAQGAPAAADQTAQAPAPESVKGNILQEVVVTGSRKRTENVQTTPITVTAVSSAMLEKAHITDLASVGALAPNLTITHTITTPDNASIYLRGFGNQNNDPASDPHVAVFIDGIYQPQTSGETIDLFDVQQVEVLAGPQGTLLGRNAPVGAISITTEKPTGQFGGLVEGDYGSYDHIGLRAKVNVPIVPGVLAAKVSVVDKQGGNWVYDTVTGKRDLGGENSKLARLSLAFTPNDDFSWNLVGTVLKIDTPQPGDRNIGSEGGVAGNSSTVNQPAPLICVFFPGGVCQPTQYGVSDKGFTTRNKGWTESVASTMAYRFEPVTLTSVTGFTNYWMVDNSDVSGTAINDLNAFDDRTTYDQETEELRVSSNKGGGWDLNGFLDWVVGGYYANYDYTYNNNLGIPLAPGFFFPPPPGVIDIAGSEHGTNVSTAVFAHVIFNFTDQWTGTFGVRQSWDHKDHDYFGSHLAFVPAPHSYDIPAGFHNTSFEAGTAYQFDKNHMAYFRFAQGYEAGGFDGVPGGPGQGSSFQPELNNAFEVGFKSDWMNHRLRANVALFNNQLSQLQVESVEPGGAAGFIQITDNAGSATVQGAEAQFLAVPIENLTLRMNLGYLQTKYDKYQGTVCSPTNTVTDCSGIPFEYAPRWTIDLGGDYVMDLPYGWGTTTFSADWDYKSSVYVSSPPTPVSYQGGFGLVNLGVKYDDPTEMYSIEFYGTNVLDRHYKLEVSNSGGLTQEQDDGRPAEWGLRVTAKF